MKKNIFIFALIAVILITAFALILFWRSPGSSVTPIENSEEEREAIPEGALRARSTFPTENLISIGTSRGVVQVRNFYTLGEETEEASSIVVRSGPTYSIIYDTLLSSFWIALQPESFETERGQAEQEFLNTLEISREDACKLDVSVGVFYTSGDSRSGRNYPLSFCAFMGE